MYHNVAWAEADLRTKWHLDPSSHLATIDMGQKLGDLLSPVTHMDLLSPVTHTGQEGME